MKRLRLWIASRLKRKRKWSLKTIADLMRPESLERYWEAAKKRKIDPVRAQRVVIGIEPYDQSEIVSGRILAWQAEDGTRVY